MFAARSIRQNVLIFKNQNNHKINPNTQKQQLHCLSMNRTSVVPPNLAVYCDRYHNIKSEICFVEWKCFVVNAVHRKNDAMETIDR